MQMESMSLAPPVAMEIIATPTVIDVTLFETRLGKD
jgi:hypothetical protein